MKEAATLLVRPSLSSMWGLKYFLLCAWVTAVAWLPIEGEGIIDGWQPFQLVNGALRRRDTGDPKSFCRYWGHSSE